MNIVTKEIQFDAGHRVPLHKSKCRNPHGHRYRVVAEVQGPLQTEGSSTGMVYDFGNLKAILQSVHDRFDHGFIAWSGDAALLPFIPFPESDEEEWKVIIVNYHPTAENLAEDIYGFVWSWLPSTVELLSITVWETPTSSATYRP